MSTPGESTLYHRVVSKDAIRHARGNETRWSRLGASLTGRIVWAHPALRWSSRLTFQGAMVILFLGLAENTHRFWTPWRICGMALIVLSLAVDVTNRFLVRRLRRNPNGSPPGSPRPS